MTEAEWLAFEDPLQLLTYLDVGLAYPNAFRLTAACFRRHWDSLPEAAQAFADLVREMFGNPFRETESADD